jgi:hypothetical protein
MTAGPTALRVGRRFFDSLRHLSRPSANDGGGLHAPRRTASAGRVHGGLGRRRRWKGASGAFSRESVDGLNRNRWMVWIGTGRRTRVLSRGQSSKSGRARPPSSQRTRGPAPGGRVGPDGNSLKPGPTSRQPGASAGEGSWESVSGQPSPEPILGGTSQEAAPSLHLVDGPPT